MLRRLSIFLIVIGLLAGLASLAICGVERKIKDDLYKQVELFSYALTVVQSDYMEVPQPKDLIYGALKGMLASLDPYSQFMDQETYKELKVETEGQFGGLGIEITTKDGLITVITPIEDTPAWKAGIKSGDRIVKVNDEITRDFTLSDAVKRLRGKPGTSVNIVILREGEKKLLELKITREIIKIHDIKEAKVLEDKVGYIRLVVFQETTPKDLAEALTKLKKSGADSLILDLRNNPGGLLDIAVSATDNFLPEGKIIVSTKGRDEKQNVVFKSKGNKDAAYLKWPMVVLINEGSASGSEILAGALQDNKRAVILGAKSFGKGSVQTVLPLPDGSALRLTTSKYFTPLNRSIQGTGIVPDVVVKEEKIEDSSKEKELDVEEVFENIEKKTTETETADKKEKSYKDDAQIMRAIDLLKGIRVYQAQSKS
ncbi:MAG: S41 family peptidase [Candidatus Omnitrophota bacterium]|nr:S41 family peptidase [Candidatus Omnitrophota bacterium]